MSSMVHTPLLKTRRLALAGAVLALAGWAGPLAAQSWGQPANGGNLVARQSGEMGTALARWEMLQASREMRFVDYAGFVLAYPNFPRSEILRLRAENVLENEAPATSDVLRYFDANPPLTNPARARYALALAGAQRPEALAEARKAWRGGAMSDPVELYLVGLYGAEFTANDHAARMDALLWQGKADAAARQAINLPEADRPLALARLALVRGSYPTQAGITAPASAMSNPGFVFNLVNYLRASGQSGEAVRTLTTGPRLTRRPAREPEEFVGDMLALAKSASSREAVQIAARVDDLFAPGTDVSQASFTLRDRYTDLVWLGGTKALWNLGDGRAAAPLFQRYGDAARTPLTKAKGYYWAGRAARQAGNEADARRYFEAAAAYPHYYYGQLAITALGRQMPGFAPLPEVAISAGDRAAFEGNTLVQAIREMAVNRRDWRTERRFFEALGDEADTPEELTMAAQLAAETGLDEMAVVIGMKAGENGLTGFERIGFPVIPTPIVNDWTMVHAISRQESEFDRTRVSHAGARGVMQLMPGTAREQAGKLGMNYMAADLTGSPSYNIQLGDAYFARMMSYYGGAYPLAVGAYNAGPGRVNEWLRLNGDPRRGEIDWVTWVEKIPANFETRYYIMRVIGNAVTYSHMYPREAGLPRPINTFLR